MFGKKDKKPDLQVRCKNCGKVHEVRWRQINIMPIGYKGNLKCYIRCKKCNEIITISENRITKKAMRGIKFRYYF